MRAWPWLFSLSLFGCNQILGLKSTHEQDAALFEAGEGPGIDTPNDRVVELSQLTYDNADGNTPTTDDSPLATDPGVRVALLTDAQLSDPLPYAAKVVHTPRAFDGQDWRMVATIDGVKQEWQWRVSNGAHVTSLIDARNPAKPTVPAGSSIEWANVPAAAGALSEVRVTTTGGWMHDRVSTTSGTVATKFDWPVPASGIAPTTAHGDAEIMTVLPTSPETNTFCYMPTAVGTQSKDLVAGTHTDGSTTVWNTTNLSTWHGPTLAAVGANRLANVLAGRHVGADATWQQAGYVMKGSIPSFNPVSKDLVYTQVAGGPGRGHVRHPEMVDILSCNATGNNASLTFLAPPSAAGLDAKMHKVWYAEISNSRGKTAGSKELTSMLQVINVVPNDDTNQSPTLTFATPLAKNIVLDAGSQHEVDLQASSSDLAMSLMIGGTHRLIPLTWAWETGVGIAPAPDDVTVIVYGFNEDVFFNLTPEWVIHTTSNSAMIDSDAFANHGSYNGYILEIVGHNGTDAAKIKSGDYTGATYPLSSASVFTYAFAVP